MKIPYYKKLLILKRFLNPLVVILDKMRLLPLMVPFANSILRLGGMEKRFNHKLDYRIFADIFQGQFGEPVQGARKIVFLFMAGAKSRHNLRNMMIARFLQDKGFSPLFLVCDGVFTICNRDRVNRDRNKIPLFCYECHDGYRHMASKTGMPTLYLSNYFDSGNQQLFQQMADRIDALNSLEACESFSFEEVPFGKMTRKSVLYYLTQGEFEGRREEILVYHQYLKSVTKFYLMFKNFLNREPLASHLILNNGELAFDNLAANMFLEQGKTYVTQESFEAPNSWIYKKNGIAIRLRWESEMARFLEHEIIRPEELNLIREMMSKRKSGQNMVYTFNNPENEGKIDFDNHRYVGLFTNFMWDTTILERNTFFDSMREWIQETVRFWQENGSNIRLIIRAHPAEVKLKTAPSARYVRDLIKDLDLGDNIIFFDSTDEVNSYEIISNIEYGIVYASSIGLEIPYHGKPCVVAGDPHYLGQDFVLSPESKSHYFETLKSLNEKSLSFTPPVETLLKYLYFIYHRQVKYLHGFQSGGLSARTLFDIESAMELVEANKPILEEFFQTCIIST